MAINSGMTSFARIAAAAVAVTATTVLLGYALHIQTLIVIAPGLQGMAVLTAIGLTSLAAALLAESWGHRLTQPAAAVSLVIGLVMLIVHAAQGADTINPILAQYLFGFTSAIAGRTSPATAACLAGLGAAVLVRDRPGLSDLLSSATLVVSGLALLGYAYGVHDLYAMVVFHTMALHTAASLFTLSLSSLFIRPHEGLAAVTASSGVGGRATRRQLTFLLLPPVAGAILLQTIQAHRLGPSAAMAFLVAVTIVPLALLILRDGRALDALESERRRRAELQAELARDLEQKLADQAADLQRAGAERVQAEQAMYRAQRMEAVGQLTGGIAHDFNNLLMAIGGNLQLLGKRLGDDHPARRYVQNAQAAADKGAKLTGQLLAFSRTQKLDIRPVEIDAVLRNVRQLLGNALGPDISVVMRPGAPGEWALTDPDQLELAILNLALNARDAMANGGELVVRSVSRSGSPGPEQDETEYLTVQVIDTGVGMTPEIAAQAMEPFFTTKERGKGTGLGLAQVYGFVRQCHGDLVIESEPGKGTTVELLLPRTSAPTLKAPAPQAPVDDVAAQSDHGRGLLLVIDDDDSVRAVLVDALRSAGFEVIEAADGREGLELLEGRTPAAAIIDFIMPGLNGAETARLAQRRQPGLPIIFVSGYFDTVALDGIPGAVVLRKPFDVDGLQRTVSSVLQ